MESVPPFRPTVDDASRRAVYLLRFPTKHPTARKRSHSAITQALVIVAKKAFSKNCRELIIGAVAVKERIYNHGKLSFSTSAT